MAPSASSKQPAQLGDRLARHDHAGNVRRAIGQVELVAREAMAVGRHGAQAAGFPSLTACTIDAVEIEARLFGRDREPRLLDQRDQIGRPPD